MASLIKTNQQIQSELHLLLYQGIISESEYRRISPNYPPETWDLIILIRSFTFIGAVAVGIGLVLLIQVYSSIYLGLEILFGVLTLISLVSGYFLKNIKAMQRSGAALELMACFTLSALTFTLGVHYAAGSGNWPALVGIDAILCLILTYVLNNRWVLIYALINVFIFFGGETGYVSGWGMYWLGMNYPLRYTLIGLICIAIAIIHRYVEDPGINHFRNFGRAYLHFGLLSVNLSLWFFSLYGYYYGDYVSGNSAGQRFLFTLLWAVVSGISVYIGDRFNDSTFRSYGLVFLIINIYTAYFQFVALNSTDIFFIHFFIMGGSMIGLAFHYEKLRKQKQSPPKIINTKDEQNHEG